MNILYDRDMERQTHPQLAEVTPQLPVAVAFFKVVDAEKGGCPEVATSEAEEPMTWQCSRGSTHVGPCVATDGEVILLVWYP